MLQYIVVALFGIKRLSLISRAYIESGLLPLFNICRLGRRFHSDHTYIFAIYLMEGDIDVKASLLANVIRDELVKV
jgi:hypothetical protein